MSKKAWFESWFDSPYYHILYQNHNEQEAQNFLDNLLQHLTPQYDTFESRQDVKILDLACGKGRHSRYMAQKGYDVTGLDLSENSIRFAQQFQNERLNFYQHDMRKPFRSNYYDYIFNIFTSFGYFENENDNYLTLKNVRNGLHTEGVFVLDYFNSIWVKAAMKPEYEQTAGDIVFKIRKRVENGHIIKTIDFQAVEQGTRVDYHFEEKVRLFERADFELLFDKAGLKIQEMFGDYQLNAFDPSQSNRLIIKAVRK